MVENIQYQKVPEITDRLEQGIQKLFESEKYMEWLRPMSTVDDRDEFVMNLQKDLLEGNKNVEGILDRFQFLENEELKEICQQTVKKLEAMTDEEFAEIGVSMKMVLLQNKGMYRWQERSKHFLYRIEPLLLK